MKKLIFVLLPLSVVIALIGYTFNTNPGWSTFLQGLQTIRFNSFDLSKFNTDWDKYVNDLKNYWSVDNLGSLDVIWSEVDNIFDFFPRTW